MAKSKKKRNKVYRGQDAKIEQPNIVRVQAVERGRLRQWWHDHERVAKPTLIGAAIGGGALLVIVEFIQLLTSGT